jgi:hypothetical protein
MNRLAEKLKAANIRPAMLFIVLIGVVSLFADMTYEGARSITGQFLATLGVSGAVVGFVAGFGELAGYAIRLVSGLATDRTRRYWAITISGYLINLGAVPALALAGRREIAAGPMIAERIGQGIRNPVRDAMLSHASSEVGRGWGFRAPSGDGFDRSDDRASDRMPVRIDALVFCGYEKNPDHKRLYRPSCRLRRRRAGRKWRQMIRVRTTSP